MIYLQFQSEKWVIYQRLFTNCNGLEFFWICLHAIKMKPIYEYITFLLQNIYYFVKIWRMKRKGVVDCHIKNICKKAVQQLNILKRIGENLSKLNRLNIFHTFVLSNFNFCPLSGHFCSETNTKKIEKIQERALRFVYQDYEASYENLLQT
jgi:hypothetical protein